MSEPTQTTACKIEVAAIGKVGCEMQPDESGYSEKVRPDRKHPFWRWWYRTSGKIAGYFHRKYRPSFSKILPEMQQREMKVKK